MTTPYEQHEADKKKFRHNREGKAKHDPFNRTEKVRRFAAQVRDHVKGLFRR
jgi:hypothetical protein